MCFARRRLQAATLALRLGICRSAYPLGYTSWRTSRPAQHKRNVPALPMMRRRYLHLLPAWSRGRGLRACPLCPFRSVPVWKKAVCCSFQKEVEKNTKMRPPARRGQAQRNCKQYLDVLTVHTHRRENPMVSTGFF